MVADLTSVCPETTPVVGPAFITVSEVIAQCLVSLSAPVDTSTPATTTKAAPPTTPKSTQRPAPTIGAQCRDGDEKHYEVCAGHKEWVGGQVETGMRPGELAGLHAHRVDVTRQRVWISDVYVRRMHAIRSTPKNGHARSVPLTRKALEIIQRRLDGRDSKAGCGVRHLDNKRCRHPLVFLNAHGGVINSDILQRRMNKAAKAAGLEPKNPYAARRGYATWLADGGLDTFQIQRLLGHADLEESKDVQESPAVAARTLDALGDTPKLRVVGDDETRGPRGPQRGPDFDNQPLPEVPSASGQFSL